MVLLMSIKVHFKAYSKNVSELKISGNCLDSGALRAPLSPVVERKENLN